VTVVMDSLAVLAYLQSGSNALNDVISSGVVVSSVTVNLVEWTLVEAGARRSEVLVDLERLGLEVMVFSDASSSRVRSLRSEIPGLSLDAALAVVLAETRRLELFTGERMLEGQASGVKVRLVT
jgi:PIN domain nuclease of toxin-antitoxin system